MKTTKLLWGILTCVLLSFAASCTEEEKEPPVDGTATDENGPITLELADLTATTALFKGSVNLNLYSEYDEVGIIYSLTEDFEIKPLVTNVVPITNIDKNNRFEKTMHELRYNTKYYYSSYICMNGIYKLGEVQSFTTDDVKIEVSAPTVTSTTATFTGKVTVDEEDLESLSFGVAWSTGNDFKRDVNEEEVELEDDGSFVMTVEGLKMEKEYHYAPYISQLDSKYGDIKKFTTTAAVMSVSASQITQTSVTFTGKAEKNSADDGIEYGILYSPDSQLEVGANGCVKMVLTDVMNANGNYSLKVDGLVNDTKYYYCWYARQGSDYKYGPSQEFTTTSITVTVSVNPITQTTATFTGSYTHLDGDDSEVGLLYSSLSTSLTYTNATKIKLNNKNFTHKVEGLKYNTSYYYCSYIRQNGKYKYGPVESFKTKDVTVEVSVSDITATSVTFSSKTEIIDSDVIEVCVFLHDADYDYKEDVDLRDGEVSYIVQGLNHNTKYYYCYEITQDGVDGVEEGVELSFKTKPIATLSKPKVTQTAVTFAGVFNFSDFSDRKYGIQYSTSSSFDLIYSFDELGEIEVPPSSDGTFEGKVDGLSPNTKYYYRCFYRKNNSYIYDDAKSLQTLPMNVSLSVGSITQTSAKFNLHVGYMEDMEIEAVGVLYSIYTYPTIDYTWETYNQELNLDTSGNASFIAENLEAATTYYYRYYVKSDGRYIYGDAVKMNTDAVGVIRPTDAIDLSENGSANCYIVSNSGRYCFKTYKGNTSTSALEPSSVEVLWESFGTSVAPSVGDLIKSVSYSDNYISFSTSDNYKEGNAVIAAKDTDGNILWSWHIWMTDQPQEQVYYNNAGTMMDRNLGATSATPGDVGALGLLYQWGRKDPFLGSSSISENVEAKSTITWESPVESTSVTGTIDYAVAHPTTFIFINLALWWYGCYWTASDEAKSVYDPCPVGWRVPDGGKDGVWSKALGSWSTLHDSSLFSSTNRGINFTGKFGDNNTIWYPASIYRHYSYGGLYGTGSGGKYWSASPYNNKAHRLSFDSDGDVYPADNNYRAYGYSVRCLKE